MPESILTNKLKTGWNSPMGEWFAGPWKEWLLDETGSVGFNNCNLVDQQGIRKKMNLFFQSKPDQNAGQELWLQLQPYLIEKANRQFASC